MNSKYKLPFPKAVRIEASGACNFMCRHCPVGLRLNKSVGIMSRVTFDKIYDQLKHQNIRAAVLYHGGEPFLNRDIFYFIKEMAKISGIVKLVSNGSLLTDELIDKILSSSLGSIRFSLDGLSPEENNKIRIGSNFNKISKQIIKLLEKREKTGSNIQIDISNVQIPKRSKKLGKVKPPAYFRKAFKDWHDQITIKSYYSIRWPGYPGKQNKNMKAIRNFCDDIQNTVTIRWNGDIVPCCYDLINKKVMGNILKTPIAEIWNNKAYQDLRKMVNKFKPPSLCHGCNVLYEDNFIYEDEVKWLNHK